MGSHEAIRRDLQKKRGELLSRVDKIRKDSSNPLDRDLGEQAVELENAEVLDMLDREARKELVQINKALESIEKNEYGRCLSCNKPIPVKRLEAIPYTNYCIACAREDQHKKG